eukprot:CAMPEP_0172695136 /NCGR_PEP_ID=MMETSP1074-20121228/27157_1 /TAXON_ID=2916 /ORGANISM="Ceratium fusus, Strain PA161109" /LENGTH=75 /DNA_ID=CAMNT_0013515723 /DNA_START=35 /DNA_END=259 /DNA_ORIENTATION=+
MDSEKHQPPTRAAQRKKRVQGSLHPKGHANGQALTVEVLLNAGMMNQRQRLTGSKSSSTRIVRENSQLGSWRGLH